MFSFTGTRAGCAPLDKEGISFLDVASGKGAYSLAASDLIGPEGSVTAIDLWAEGIEMLKAAAQERGIKNLTALVSDVSRRIPKLSNYVKKI